MWVTVSSVEVPEVFQRFIVGSWDMEVEGATLLVRTIV